MSPKGKLHRADAAFGRAGGCSSDEARTKAFNS